MIKTRDLNKIKKNLPRPYAPAILEKLKEKHKKVKASKSLIMAVMNNYKVDYHGIIDAAIEVAAEEKKRKEEQSKQYQEKIKQKLS